MACTQLASRSGALALGAPRVRVSSRRNVVVRAKEVREYREDSGEVVVSGAEGKKDAPLYADQVAAAVSIYTIKVP